MRVMIGEGVYLNHDFEQVTRCASEGIPIRSKRRTTMKKMILGAAAALLCGSVFAAIESSNIVG